MKHIFRKIVLLSFLMFLYDGLVAQNREWRIVYNQDFGGNDKSDPAIGSELKNVTFQNGMLYNAAKSGIIYGGYYYVTKSAVNFTSVSSGSQKWSWGGDHTVISDDNRGYFVCMDPWSVGTQGGVIFKTGISVNCESVKFHFSAYLANINLSSTEACEYGLALYSDAACTNKLASSSLTDLVASPKNSLAWTEVKLDYTLNTSVSEIYFCIESPSLAVNGYDIALDDITISVEQPEVTISHSDYEFQSDVKLSASFDNGGFFTDMSNVYYKWQYSSDGVTFADVTSEIPYGGSGDYVISSFDRNKDNGTYRVAIGPKGSLDDPICSIRKDLVIDEPFNAKNYYHCYGEDFVLNVSGSITTHSWPSILSMIAGGAYYFEIMAGNTTDPNYHKAKVTVSEEPKVESGKSVSICVNTEYNGKMYDKIGTQTFADTLKNVHGCDSVYVQTTLDVTGPTRKIQPVEHLCMGEASSFNSKVYAQSGSYLDSNRVSCFVYIQPIEVHDTTVEDRKYTLCQGESLFGDTFNTPGVFSKTFRLTNRFGCDSTINAEITVNPVEEVDLDTVYVCEGDVYVFNGITYSKPGVYDPKEVLSSKVTGCDSINHAHIVINDRYDNRGAPYDTIICYNSKLFGTIYPNPTTTPILVRDPTIYTSVHGCDSLVYFNVTVLKIELKLSISSESDQVCEGDEIEIYVKDLRPSNTPLQWTPDPGGSNPNRKSFKPSEDFICVVKARSDVANDEFGHHCETTDEVAVYVNPTPKISIDTVNLKENIVEYSVTGGTEPFSFKLDDKILDNKGASGSLSGMSISTHKLYLTDANGCRDMESFVIEPVPVTPYPFFTPDGDGVNDRWEIDGIEVYPNSRVRIYNRDGKLLSDTKGYTNEEGWDGTYMGNPLPSTDYWYEIDLPEADVQYVGHFTLLRVDR